MTWHVSCIVCSRQRDLICGWHDNGEVYAGSRTKPNNDQCRELIYASEVVALVRFFATVFSLKPFLNRLDTSLR